MFKKICKVISIILVFIICGCGRKYPLSPNQFQRIMDNNKYEITEVTDNYHYEGLNKAYKASNKKYDINYYKLNTTEQAINFYESSQVNLNLNKINNKTKTDYSSNHYSKYTLTSSDSYLILSRIDNTVIYSSVDKKYKKDINKIVKKIGYK